MKNKTTVEFSSPSARRRGIDMAGMVFGRLTVDRFAGIAKGHSWWWCNCECGESIPVRSYSLLEGNTRSCGCYARDVTVAHRTKHGLCRSAEYRIWHGMIGRCHRPTNGAYHIYGAAGVSVCQRWRDSFADFLSDVGPRPSKGHSLDRYPNQKGNYEPGNVRWATHVQQQRNRSNNTIIEFFGKSMTIADWADETGLTSGSIGQRLANGWTTEEALTVPYGAHRATYKKLKSKAP